VGKNRNMQVVPHRTTAELHLCQALICQIVRPQILSLDHRRLARGAVYPLNSEVF
jgi:hypothetical protein